MILKIHLQPGARKNEIVGMHGDAIKIKLKAPPIEGRANEALIEFLAETLGIAKSKIAIIRGHTSRQKVLNVDYQGDILTKLIISSNG